MSLMRQFPELMNLQAASEALHVSRATLHRWLDSGKIQTIKYPDSNRRLITADEVQRMLELGMEKTMENAARIDLPKVMTLVVFISHRKL